MHFDISILSLIFLHLFMDVACINKILSEVNQQMTAGRIRTGAADFGADPAQSRMLSGLKK